MESPQERFWRKVDFDGPIMDHMNTRCWIWTGAKKGSPQGGNAPRYGNFWIDGRLRYAHRVAYFLEHGELADAAKVDHICLNSLCCNPDHLRLVTHKQNAENRSGANRNNMSSGVRGVRREGRRWVGIVWHHGKKIRVGLFDTIEEADTAVRAKRLELFTHNDIDRLCS